jgi:hypothetical protein
MVDLISAQMRRHEAVFLEEPPVPGFQRMLDGELSIGDYLLPQDLEYPGFSRAMCRLLREIHAEGIRIYQSEPFIENLVRIHEFFAEGHRPDELDPKSLSHYVYRAERAATGALLNYYQAVSAGSFEEALDAVMRFARADAARFRLRDSLRAQELARLIPGYGSSFVEAGLMHFPLWRMLRQLLPASARVRPVFLADAAPGFQGKTGRFYGPGDQLTLLYVLHPATAQPPRERLLAARAMIHAKILEKEEMEGGQGDFRHLRDELACIQAVRGLSFEDCRQLFPRLRRAGTSGARGILAERLQAGFTA